MSCRLPVLALVLLWMQGARASDPDLPFIEYLDKNHLVCLKWGFNDEKEEITFKFVVNTTGWIGFGLSPNGNMFGADIVIGAVAPGGNHFTDRHGVGTVMPVIDEEQNCILHSMGESDGQTWMKFSRKFLTCDKDDYHIKAGPQKLIYAYGLTDMIGYHQARRGTKTVNLLSYKPQNDVPDSTSITVRVDNLVVPAIDTYYHCKITKLPYLAQKHHIYKIEAVIDSYGIVHHILLYKCPKFVTQGSDKACFTGDVGDYCMEVVAAWAVGGTPFELPEIAGIPVGGEDEDQDIFYRLEIHYNNPLEQTGWTDSSGIRLYTTAILRQHDAAILTTGIQPFGLIDYNIPKGAEHFRSYGMCNTSLFPQLIENVPVLNVFGVMLHTHLAGRKVRVGHFGDKEQLLAVNENYDFEMQESVLLGEHKKIKPMGFSTSDEMCLAFLLYYPAIEVTSCLSNPNVTHLSNSFQ
ncbi:DBH-like monooxygenase protein 2 homolog [Neosynchiropus ocellatus]